MAVLELWVVSEVLFFMLLPPDFRFGYKNHFLPKGEFDWGGGGEG